MDNLATAIAVVFIVHCITTYAIIKLLVTGKAVWFEPKDQGEMPKEPHDD